MLSEKGNEILKDIYTAFRSDYLFVYPGSNENDVERAFLSELVDGLYGYLDETIKQRIETIR